LITKQEQDMDECRRLKSVLSTAYSMLFIILALSNILENQH